ncbi:hypothetical protein KK083_25825 [Fulvivirgaceae bacterium PWU4]|uniref:PA14 domain-containing protein n=1 Tax=Chryseosolibacter histidini TaxID=2782349 RepID=A0AAP2DSP3_9BACT|nr:PA14 domain-containing protein [Chryseosolibacter histidini]MBT1700332.1 hypothetical protein [Chryseosolibacter histidini]
MKKITTSLVCMMLFFTVCCHVCAQPLRIMPLGNSITQSEYTHLSYRYYLWQKLKAANVNFDFVGSMNTNYLGSPVYPDPSFDRDHEGHWLYRADSLLLGLPQWLTGYVPDVVLMHAGTNDVLQNQTTASTVQELKSIIDVIRARNPNVTILLAKLIGTTRSANTGIIALNNQMDGIAAEKSTGASRVIVVDQYTGFNPVTDTQEGIHPNAIGEEKMAQKWFEAITQLLMPGSGTGLRAEYFNNVTLAAPVVTTRVDAQINFDWGTGSPGAGINENNYSARWTGQVESPITGNVIFSTVSDDGVRLWVNDVQVIDNWTTHAPTANNSIPIALTAGLKYNIRMEFFENAGGAVARLLWSYTGQSQQPVPQARLFPAAGPVDPGGSGTGLRADYFNNINLVAPVILSRTDAQVNFDWGTGSPGAGINADSYSVRWTGQVESPVTGNVIFSTVSDDGVRLWINDVQVINNWTTHAPTANNSTPMALTAGTKYNVRMEFFENTIGAVARLLWSYTGQSQQPIPQNRLYPAAGPVDPGGSGTGLRAEYFNNISLVAPMVVTRTDPQVNFDWGTGSPASGINADNYSVRWTGQVESPVTGPVIFSTFSDDGVRLWVNDVQLINNWGIHAPTLDNSTPVSLVANMKYNLRMEFFENAIGAVARLLWSYTGQSQQAIPQSRLYTTQSMAFARSFAADDDADSLLRENRQRDAMLHREFSCYPNPLRQGDLHVVVTSAEITLCKIAIYASDARLLAERCFYLAKGNNDLVIPLSDLSEGLNLVVLHRDDMTPVSRRVMVGR